jgi:hypothetical protein
MVHASDYILHVTAGPTYDPSTHDEVKVNTSEPIKISSELVDASVKVRIKDFRGMLCDYCVRDNDPNFSAPGLPEGSPSTCEYFSHPKHTSDLYSISFSFIPKSDDPNEQWSGDDLIFGNDFDHSIKDRLPPGFSYAFKFVTWSIDPGMFGDPYAEEPYIYSPMLSSVNSLRIGEKTGKPSEQKGEDEVITEGSSGDGEAVRQDAHIPADAAARQKHFLNVAHRQDFKFEKGREYSCDFFNPYLDFNEFSLKLPIITIPIIGHWDGQPLR